MTTTINLRPWREERRKQRQQEFFALLIFAAALGAAIFWFWQQSVQAGITDQRERNRFVQQEISVLEEKISEIDELEQRREELIERMEVIQSLQGNRPTIVYIFDQLVRTLPDGVYYTEVTRSRDSFTILGVAESNAHISRLMRNLERSDWFKDPNLGSVTALGRNGANRFALTVKETMPGSDEEDEQ